MPAIEQLLIVGIATKLANYQKVLYHRKNAADNWK